jgi:hypothetical protein
MTGSVRGAQLEIPADRGRDLPHLRGGAEHHAELAGRKGLEVGGAGVVRHAALLDRAVEKAQGG